MDVGKINKGEKEILDYLKTHTDEYLNIRDISKAMESSYPTILKRIEILERLGFIKIITVGNNKICMLNEK